MKNNDNQEHRPIITAEISLIVICLCLCAGIVAYSFIKSEKAVTPVVVYASAFESVQASFTESYSSSESNENNAVNLTNSVLDALPPVSSESSLTVSREKININNAAAAELDALPGIGEVKAAAIVEYRTEHGKFQTIDELINVSGIGEKTLEKIRDYISVS